MSSFGMGGFISQMLSGGDPSEKIARQLSPGMDPNTGQPAALAQVSPQQPGAAQPQQQPQQPQYAPAAMTQTNPTVMENMMRMYNMDARAASLNHAIAGVAAGFGTAQQQHDKMAQLAGEGQMDDRVGVLNRIMDIQKLKTDQDNALKFQQSVGMALKQMHPDWSDARIQADVNNQQLAQQDLQPTTSQKEFEVAQQAIGKQVRAQHPDWTDAQVQAEVNNQVPPSMLVSGIGNLKPADQEYYQYAAGERAAGRLPIGPVEWNEQQKVKAVEQETHTKNVTEAKDQAVLDYPNIDANLSRSEEIINKLLANKKATIAAINTMPSRKTGWWAANTPWGASDEVRTAAADLQTLMSTLAGEGLKNVKNVRNVREFQALADSLSAGLKTGNTDEGIESTLNDLLKRFSTTRSVAREQAGMPAEEAPKAESSAPKIPNFNPKTGEFE